MLQPYASLNQRPRAVFLRRIGTILLLVGLTLNVWLLISRAEVGWRLGLMAIMPGALLLFSAFLVERTPSMRGCLTAFGLVMAFVVGFWAWAGIATALNPEGEPPEMFRQAPTNEPLEGENAPSNAPQPTAPSQESAAP
jgi:uncharacterized membrane protein HdeD (DUF308 family)